MNECDMGAVYRLISQLADSDHSIPVKITAVMYALPAILINIERTKELEASCKELIK